MKVIQYGMGPIGAKVTAYLLERKNIQIVGAVDIDPAKTGKDLGEVAGLGKNLGITVTDNAQQLFKNTEADVVVLTTSSELEKIKPQVLEIVENGLNVVSTCEELTYPWLTNPQIAKEIDDAAKSKNVSVLSTGVNPGFLMDFLPVAATGICKEVKKVKVERIQNAQFRRIPFQRKIGAGLTMAQFEEKKKSGTLRHVGLTESVHMIATRLGWKLDKTEDIIEPVVAEDNTTAGELKIEKGNALGVMQTGRGYVNGEEKITLLFKAYVGEPEPRDRIVMDSTPPVDMTIKGGINGDIATCAITVNAIPIVKNAKPGLRTMADIEPISTFS